MSTFFQRAEELLKDREKMEHLDLGELQIAVFNKDEERTDRIKKHLAKCALCQKLVDDERAENSLYSLLLKHRETGRPDKEYWDEMRKIQEEMKSK